MKVGNGKTLNSTIKKTVLKLFLLKNFYQAEEGLIALYKIKMGGDGLELNLQLNLIKLDSQV